VFSREKSVLVQVQAVLELVVDLIHQYVGRGWRDNKKIYFDEGALMLHMLPVLLMYAAKARHKRYMTG
jgi:hypothetical protein